MIGGQRQYIRHAIHHDPHHALPQIQDDHHRVIVVLHIALAELHAQVHDRHNHTAQVGHTLDKRWRVRNARYLVVTANFLHFQDVDTVLFIT